MSTDEQIAKLTKDLERLRKQAQDYHNMAQMSLGAAQYAEGQLLELKAAKAKESPKAPPAKTEPTPDAKPNVEPPMPPPAAP